MDTTLWLKGLLLGFAIAAPVGPIGVLCIRRTLAQGRAAGLAAGLGAATADAVYGAVAGLGLTAISAALLAGRDWLAPLGGAFLCYLGLRTLLARPAEGAPDTAGRPPARDLPATYASTLLLTLTNPMTILSFTAMYAGVLGGVAPHRSAALWLVFGVFTGSALWWLLLSGAVSLLSGRLGPAALAWANRLSGAVLIAFGALALVGAL